MRIIAGKYKGKTIDAPKGDHARPTADMVRQALFTKLQFFIGGKSVLDLFAGSGAIGIEAISRGATEVVFVDENPLSISCIKKNLEKITEKGLVLETNYAMAIKKLAGKKFDLIYIDPPYASNLYLPALRLIFERELLAPNGIVVCEHLASEEILPAKFFMFDQKKYGIKKLSYFSLEKKE
ncbi:MAG: 16S rRNA (guanine(966)-N(2))-methyltransferase RsmD [Clostridia bacterium]